MLHDTKTYIIVNKDPINKLVNNLRCLFTRWKSYEYITLLTTKILYTSNEILPRVYELSKIHKPGFFFRFKHGFNNFSIALFTR